MANKSVSMINTRQILRMHHEHHSMREIEKYLGVACQIVSKYISLARTASITDPDIQDKEIFNKIAHGKYEKQTIIEKPDFRSVLSAEIAYII